MLLEEGKKYSFFLQISTDLEQEAERNDTAMPSLAMKREKGRNKN